MTKVVDHIQAWAPTIATMLCVILAGWIWMPQERGFDGRSAALAPTASIEARDEFAKSLQIGAQQLAERPLFHVSRRPPKQAEQVQAAPVNVTLSLTGVLDDNNIQIALLRLSNSPELLRKRVGETIGEWTILDITNTTITVHDASGQEQMIGLSSATQNP